MNRPKTLGLAAVITACLLWSGSFFLGKIALREIPAVQVVWWRFVLAILLLVPLSRWTNGRRRRMPDGTNELFQHPRWKDVPLFVLNALLMVPLQFVLQFEGLARTTASSAALLVGVFAPMMALAGVLFSGEKLRAAGWLAVVCSSLGIVLMVGSPGEGRTLLGDLMVAGSLLCAVGMVLVTQRLLRRYEVLSITVWTMGLGTLTLLPWVYHVSGWPGVHMHPATWGALGGLGLGCTAAAFTLWNWGLRYVPASQAGVFVNLEPFIGAVLGIFLLNEAVTTGLVTGGTLILGAALLVSWPRSAVKTLA